MELWMGEVGYTVLNNTKQNPFENVRCKGN